MDFQTERMNITAQANGGALIVTVDENRIDAAVAVAFKDKVNELAGSEPKRVILDLKNVDFLDCSGLGAVVAVMKLLGQERKLELASLRPAVEKVFKLTRMDSVFSIHADIGAAIPAAA